MPDGYNHLIRDQRSQIYALKSSGLKQKDIAAHLGVHPSTISRELNRNQGGRGYRFQQADNLAIERRQAASSTPKRMIPSVVKIIEEKIQEKWSPEQISGRLKLEENISISYESIYVYIWKDKHNGGDLYTHLRHSGKKYNKRSSGKAGRGCIPNRIDIKERPSVVEEKSRLGDWEGDTIIGANHQGAILSIVDRKSKFTLLAKLENKCADGVVKATKACFDRLSDPIVHTITYDNGKEFSAHEQISALLDAQCYFATPYHSWERGLNEHTNGLVRQYVPKGTDFSTVSTRTVQKIENAINDRPRKILSYWTPKEMSQRVPKMTKAVFRC
jgi:IS30 family transposase